MKRVLSLATILLSLLILTACQEEHPAQEPATDEAPKQTAARPAMVEEEAQQQKTIVSAQSGVLMHEPIKLNRFESIAEALPVWREYIDQKPALLLLSGAPALVITPEDTREHIDHLAGVGNSEGLRKASTRSNPEALFHPSISIDIALRNKWLSQLSWVVPTQDQFVVPELETIRNQLFEKAMISEAEAASFIKDKQFIKGDIRNTPLVISNMSGLELTDKPVILHIDLSYLQGLYKNEIATPTLQTIYSTLAALKERNIEILAATFSYGHLDNQIALDVRFIGEIVEQLIGEPSLLDKKTPANWKRQADAIYLVNFFQGEKVDEIHRAQEQDDPGSAWIKFNLYRSSANLKQGEQALEYLAQAVALDPMYAYEYGNLARMAYERKRPDETMRMYALASKALPDDHLIKLSMAELAANLGDHKAAKHLAEQLKELPWAPPYHGEMHSYLDDLISRLEISEETENKVSQ